MSKKKVSIIIPAYNESNFIGKAIKSLLQTDYPLDLLEIIVVDGGSTDNTVDIVKQISQQTTATIKILHNPRRLTPVSLNTGIRYASGELIIRADAHTIYPPKYIDQLVEWKQKLGADNLGGVFVHTALYNTKVNHAIIAVLDSPFGVGNAAYRTLRSGEPLEVDTVPFGIWDRQLFDRIGYFNEQLQRNQDIEFNKRIKAHGGKIFLLPNLHLHYYPRSTWREFIKYAFENSKWNILTIFITRSFNTLSLRHFVPLFFVLGLLGSLILSLWSKIFLFLFVVIILLYLMVDFGAAIKSVRRETTIFHIVITFFLWHFFYGLGEIWGVFCALTMRKKVNT